jgi:AcrR family transcriptional regulator
MRRHRQELLQTTEILLARKRFHEMTIQDIAMESEFSVGYIYKLFPNKEEIVCAFVHGKLAELRILIEENLDAGGIWSERLLQMLNAMFTWLEQTPAYRSGVIPDFNLFARTHPGLAAELSEFKGFFEGRTQALFNEAVDLGHLAEDEPGTIARTFRALVSGFSDDKLLEQRPGERLAAHAPLIVNIIKRAFAPKGGGC